ncbi:MAG: septal ring lytic transglycosylase RlpA family protein [Woeseia sp.]|nr:septal ring lytic transglycosylase RlpA family protein [Woeseia sp.]NNE60121.1 septal ring lytic transglycosylase RlpA family protein [Woeseia sp.]NNL54540.1 septal ring lytic transglycosylase RlpA family protein [Woeseia sp.]
MNSRRLAVLALATMVAGCTSHPVADRVPATTASRPATLPADPVPRPEPPSRYGNGPIYEVFGQSYEVMDSSHGYQERGVASWYGSKFHGRPTSSQEPYDMHQLTAAHKSLPLPTYVQVRNLRNNRTVVVRVNDRGPFVDNRIIDLSYAAARRLDMIRDGTSLVEVTALSFDTPPDPMPESIVDAASATVTARNVPEKPVYLQVGAFGSKLNAERRHRLLLSSGIAASAVHEDRGVDSPLYRVRIGPLDGAEHYDRLVAEITALGIQESHLVTD